MDILAQAISLLLETENKSLSTDSNETVLLELLTSSYETSSEYEERAKGFSFETVGPWYIICIKNTNNQPSAALRAYRNHLSLILPSVSMAVYQDRLILLDHESEHSFVINTLNTFLKSNQLTAAVSSLFTDISEVPRYAIQAQDLLELAFILKLNDTILHFQNYSLYHAAFVIHKSSNADYYIPEELYSVMDYDSEYGTKYCDSIRSWLEFRSLVKAANALNIHRNTMVYHYDKFQELSGFDLSHGEDLFRLRLAFLLLDLQNKGYISQWDQTD
ncbi:MAG: PucR family transcriptional regulator [Lachnospiraceae bacterium]